MPERVLSFTREEVERMLKSGEMKIISNPAGIVYAEPRITDLNIEKAKKLFGENFLGKEAINTFEEKCRVKGIDVKFEIPDMPFPYSQQELEEAAKNKRGGGRLLVLRPGWMRVGGDRQQVNIFNLRELFKSKISNDWAYYSKNPFGKGSVFISASATYINERYFYEPLQEGYAMPTKKILRDLNKTWDQYNDLLEPGEKRRTAVEAIWDMLLYYGTTGKKMLTTADDWTDSMSGMHGVGVGWVSGIYTRAINRFSKGYHGLGIVPTR